MTDPDRSSLHVVAAEPPRVLLVEDEVRLAQVVARGLDHEGFSVDVVHSGPDGLWAATEHVYEAVLLDLGLPGMNGLKVMEHLRARQVWTPVMVLTAKDGECHQVDAFDGGADDYLVKPFSIAILVARLRAMVRRCATDGPEPLRAGDLVVEVARRRAVRGTTYVELTGREVELLAYLMRHRGEVVSKGDILEAVWGGAGYADPNLVEAYVHYLRVKIDQPFARRAIETVRGLGYRLAADGG